jgi:hypothetical protein
MTRDKLCRLEIEIYNATRKFANRKNKENKKQIYFAKMEDQAGNGTNSTIIKLESTGLVRTYGFVRATYLNNSYDEEDWKIKIDGPMIHDKNTEKRVYHKIVGDYKEFLIQEIPGIKRKVV